MVSNGNSCERAMLGFSLPYISLDVDCLPVSCQFCKQKEVLAVVRAALVISVLQQVCKESFLALTMVVRVSRLFTFVTLGTDSISFFS